MTMDTGRLLMGKVDINEATADDIRLATVRQTSGAIDKKSHKKADEPKTEESDAGGMAMPDIDEIIAREGLNTLRLADKIEADIKAKETEWDARIKDLPGQADMDDYEKRAKDIEKLFKGNTKDKLKAVKQANDLRKDIKAAIKKSKKTAKDLERDYKGLKSDAKAALKAPAADYKRLKNKYPISSGGLGNMGALLFGPKVGGYIQKAQSLYTMFASGEKKAEPKPVRGKGVDIKFKEFEPAADFRIRSMLAGVTTASGTVEGTIEEISSDQSISGKPTTFKFESKSLTDGSNISSIGSFDHVKPGSAEDEIYFSMSDTPVSGMKLSDSAELPITVKSGRGSVEVYAKMRTGGLLNAKAEYVITKANIEADASEGASKMMAAVGRTISSLNAISVSAKATGTLDDYDIDISTDADDALKNAASGLMKEEAKKYEAKLKAAIDKHTAPALAGLNDKLGGIEGKKSAIFGNSKEMEATLKGLSGIKAGSLLSF